MQVSLAVLADAANMTPEGKLNILGEFNSILAVALPVRWPMMRLVLKIDARPEEGRKHRLAVRAVDEKGNVIAKIGDGTIDLGEPFRPGLSRRGQMIVEIEGATFPSYGTYRFEILVDGNTLGSVPLYVYEPGEQQSVP